MTTYRPHEHAAALADWMQLILHQSQEIAALRGDVKRLMQVIIKDKSESAAMDGLVLAIYASMHERTWNVTELLGRSVCGDAPALALAAAIASTGCSESAKGLGTYLSRRTPGGIHVTPDGHELRFVGKDSAGRLWSVCKALKHQDHTSV